MSNRRPDPFDVDLEALGSLPPELRASIDADPALVAERAEVAQMREWWQAHAPPFPATPPRRVRSWPRVAAVGVTLALAATALFILRPGVGPAIDVPGPEVVARGGADEKVLLLREGVPLTPDTRLFAGDEVSLYVFPEQDGRIVVATVEEGGEVSVLVEGDRARAGMAYQPPGRIRLDAHSGREWLVVWVGEGPAPAEIESAARALLPEPVSTESRFVREISRGRR